MDGTFGSHSAKATVLSWLAKIGAEPSLWKFLGYHSEGKDGLLTKQQGT